MPVSLSTIRAARQRLVAARDHRISERRSVCVLGPGKAFLSGMTYHTFGLVSALSQHGATSAILLRNLVPRHLYPGRTRIGADLSHLRLPPTVERADRVDWWWGPGMLEAAWMLVRRPPAVLVVQWWSAAVWHTQLALVALARIRGAKVVIEVHELMDTAEARHPLAGTWSQRVAPLLIDRADHIVVHNDADRVAVMERFGVRRSQISVIAEPPFDNYHLSAGRGTSPAPAAPATDRIELLSFGTIRPYKGVEDLIDAFDQLCAEPDGHDWRLTVVGETWEGWTAPQRRIASSPNAGRITFVNRYVPDEEVDRWFVASDLVVLPYHRSSTSGPLMVAMSYGLPVVVTRVGGLPEAVADYRGAVLVDPQAPALLAEGIRKAALLVGQHHEVRRSWADAADEHEAVFRSLGVGGRS